MIRPVLHWLALNGKETLETLALVAGLFFTGASFRAAAKERRIANLMSLTQGHRELWLQLNECPALNRILEQSPDLDGEPVLPIEKRFVHLLITHLAVSHAAMREGLAPQLSRLEDDVRAFFSIPIPKQVWEWSRQFQDAEFVAFVEACLLEKPAKKKERFHQWNRSA
jgi:hypothetical protein